ncbi:M20/M25/M40 family metallo-hydrolase [Leucobacter sp. OH1287]|uniref:M20/M25/M40 family metallo-hydrolase n=1 Tax=Leucobacter sp. OH1287 TaxID=2491049 RepID=UPI000F5E1CF2|nr:M20/M25/M40 family metallo-hydrolase [Leucobacter sp. OH1287]RRD61897.1 M20/M25/M40 family metallo-hydrolase [Leucobacter sp. OH1287]
MSLVNPQQKPDSSPGEPVPLACVSETARIAADLIRIDTSNRGQGDANPELPAAEYVAEYLTGLGLKPQFFESAPGRVSVVTRVPGADPTLPALVLHGHLDVVPADPANWSVDPFAGVIKDGMLWGRGAVDMKIMDAMMLTAVAELLRAGELPRRELILAFFADEENGGVFGSQWLVKNHPEVFAGAATAVSEVGGYSVHFGDKRAYLLQTGEKCLDWVRLTAKGTAQHGSSIPLDNPLTKLARAVARVGDHEWPVELTPTTAELLQQIEQLTGPGSPTELVARAGAGSGFLKSSLRVTTNPTVLDAGYMHNVIPDTAGAIVDMRSLPGSREAAMQKLVELVGDDADITPIFSGKGMETDFSGELVEAVRESLLRHDPEAVVLPYLLSGGTDNKHLSDIGIVGYGFAPLKLPRDMDFPAMFHGVDERVPLTAIDFGHRVLLDFLRTY